MAKARTLWRTGRAEPQLERLLQHRDAFLEEAAPVDHQHAALAGAPRAARGSAPPRPRLFAGEPVQIEVALQRVVALLELAQQAAIDAGREALDVLVGAFDVERGPRPPPGRRAARRPRRRPARDATGAASSSGSGAPSRPRGSGASSTTPSISSANNRSSVAFAFTFAFGAFAFTSGFAVGSATLLSMSANGLLKPLFFFFLLT